MTDELKELRRLTAKIPNYNPHFLDDSRVMKLVCESGHAESIGVYRDRNISIARTKFSANAVLPEHTHDQKEVIHVLQGEIILTVIENETHKQIYLSQYDSYEIMPKVRHYCSTLTKTVIIAITMPYSPHFPTPILDDDTEAQNNQKVG